MNKDGYDFDTCVYLADSSVLKDCNTLKKYYYAVPAQFRRDIDALRSGIRIRRALAGIFLFKKGLKDLDIQMDDIKIEFGDDKQMVANRDNLNFHVSYSEDIVICALGVSRIGCNIQRIKPVPVNMFKKRMSDKCFNIVQRNGDRQDDHSVFFRWLALDKSLRSVFAEYDSDVRKRSDFDYMFDDEGTVRLFLKDSGNAFYFREYEYADYRIACCGINPGFEKECRIVDLAKTDDKDMDYYGVEKQCVNDPDMLRKIMQNKIDFRMF